MIWTQHHLPELIFALLVVAAGIVWLRMSIGGKGRSNSDGYGSGSSNPNRFSCGVEIVRSSLTNPSDEEFCVRMRGKIVVPHKNFDTDVQVGIQDITDSLQHPLPVYSRFPQWRKPDNPDFFFRGYNGKIPSELSILNHWVQVIRIPISALAFAKQGNRRLLFIVSILSKNGGRELLNASSQIHYTNRNSGYQEAASQTENPENLCLQIAVAVGSLTQPLSPNGIGILHDWIQHKIRVAPESQQQVLQQSLEETLQSMLEESPETSVDEIVSACQEIHIRLSVQERYQLVRLCFILTAANGSVTPLETTLLNRMAEALKLDNAKFRSMAQKLLPTDSQNQQNLEFLLGITSQMTAEEARIRLNEEYQKWNSRVTHPDTRIQEQAERMLRLIGLARNQYVTPLQSTGLSS